MKRLAEDTATPTSVRTMIAAARAEAPTPAALERMLARVEAPSPRGGLSRRFFLVAGGAAVAIAIGAFLLRGQHSASSDRPAPRPAESTPPPSAPVVSALPDDSAPATTPPAPSPPAPPPKSATPRAHHAPTPAPPPPATEVSLVEEARAALAARDFRAALAAAARHQKLYPAGVLTEEREAIRIEALAGTGDAGAARDRLRGFLHRFPRSSYRRHLEEVAPPP